MVVAHHGDDHSPLLSTSSKSTIKNLSRRSASTTPTRNQVDRSPFTPAPSRHNRRSANHRQIHDAEIERGHRSYLASAQKFFQQDTLDDPQYHRPPPHKPRKTLRRPNMKSSSLTVAQLYPSHRLRPPPPITTSTNDKTSINLHHPFKLSLKSFKTIVLTTPVAPPIISTDYFPRQESSFLIPLSKRSSPSRRQYKSPQVPPSLLPSSAANKWWIPLSKTATYRPLTFQYLHTSLASRWPVLIKTPTRTNTAPIPFSISCLGKVIYPKFTSILPKMTVPQLRSLLHFTHVWSFPQRKIFPNTTTLKIATLPHRKLFLPKLLVRHLELLVWITILIYTLPQRRIHKVIEQPLSPYMFAYQKNHTIS